MMADQISIEEYREAYYRIRQYEFQQMPPGRSLMRLLYALDVPTALRHGIERLLAYGVHKRIILFPTGRDVSDVYFSAYFDIDDFSNAYSWWGRSFGPKSVDTLARAFKKSNCAFGQKIETPLPMPDLIKSHLRRDQESRHPMADSELPKYHLGQKPIEPDDITIEAIPAVITLAQYQEAISRYFDYEEQRRGSGRPLLKLLKNADAPARVYTGVVNILQHYIREKLIPFTYSGDVTDAFFVSYFTGEDLLEMRNFGAKALTQLKIIMAANNCPFK